MSPARSTPGCPPAAEMVHATSPLLLLLLLSLALVAPSLSARKVTGWGWEWVHLVPTTASCPPLTPSSSLQCSLTGKWTNNLGSIMTIRAVNSRGEFTGTYLTAVADNPGNITLSPLLGIQHKRASQPTFGFTVNWKFSGASLPASLQCPCSSAVLLCDKPLCFPALPHAVSSALLPFPTVSLTVSPPRCGVPDDFQLIPAVPSTMPCLPCPRCCPIPSRRAAGLLSPPGPRVQGRCWGCPQRAQRAQMSCPLGRGTMALALPCPAWGSQPHSPHLPLFPTESTSVFVGQCFVDRSGKEVLKTKWLQRLAVDDISDDWIATR